jgi:hypothetical protein
MSRACARSSIVLIAPACTGPRVQGSAHRARAGGRSARRGAAGPLELSVGMSNTLNTRTPRLATPTASVECDQQA